MSVKEEYSDRVVYCGGHLTTDPEFTDRIGQKWPRGASGLVRNECGMASVYVDYWKRTPGGFVQFIRVETVFNGRTYDYQREATKPDWVTENGAKRIAHRWLRDIHHGVK